MDEFRQEIGRLLEEISLAWMTMEGEDIPALGEILNHLSELRRLAPELASPPFEQQLESLAVYLEKLVLREVSDRAPVDEEFEHLQAMYRCLLKGDDPQSVLERKAGQANPQKLSGGDDGADSPLQEFSCPSPQMNGEDREIVNGFIDESLEGLEAVELRLVDLEHDPSDADSINAIFRAFHTIKGVSSFLGFMRINQLAHRSENLLEKLRNRELEINAAIVDTVLDAVDALKKMVLGIQSGLMAGHNLDIGLDITPLVERIDAIQAPGREGILPVGEILVNQGVLSRDALSAALELQKQVPGKKIGRILVDEGIVDESQVCTALQEQKKAVARKVDVHVKVDTQKLDNLVDLTGELVIAQSMLRQHPYLLGAIDQQLIHALSQLNQISAGLQAMSMSLRMVPIRHTFQKMVRLVRDLARSSGKQVQLLMSGEETEIDRNVVDQLYEPMVHMIRNSIDHGLGTPEERRAAGKEASGTIHLKAYHSGGHIMVEICDDGKGLDRGGILEKARSKGLIDNDTRLADTDIYALIFQPGFSTAGQVTEISGRGVGMDVVKKAIEQLRGRVDIDSTPGQGTVFTIRLPLTLAIIDGMLVRVGRQRYVIPTLAVVESFRPTHEQCSTVQQKGEMVLSRGNLIPLVRLEQIFEEPADAAQPWEGLVVTVEHDGRRMGILLDELLGKEQVVIKSLGEGLGQVKGVAGGAILGDGRVGLILDIAGIWSLAMT